MKIKRIKKLRINNTVFKIIWNKKFSGGNFYFKNNTITIGTKKENIILECILHELFEICCLEMGVRYDRTDCETDYLFNFNHQQHTTLICMLSGLIEQFIE